MIMQPDRRAARVLTWLAAAMLLVPGPAWSLVEGRAGDRSSRSARSAQPTQAAVTSPKHVGLLDVRLRPGGTLSGRVRDEGGLAMARATVVVSRARQVVARAVTDDRGKYLIKGLAGGVYRVRVAAHESIVRLWTSESAPPQAREQLDLNAASQESLEARGQGGERGTPDDGGTVRRLGLDGNGGLDAVELAMLTTSVISLTLSAVMLAKIDELQDSVDLLPASD